MGFSRKKHEAMAIMGQGHVVYVPAKFLKNFMKTNTTHVQVTVELEKEVVRDDLKAHMAMLDGVRYEPLVINHPYVLIRYKNSSGLPGEVRLNPLEPHQVK